MTKTRLTRTAMLDILRGSHDQAWKAAHKIRFPSESKEQLSVLLYFTLIELAGSAGLLIMHKRVAGMAAIARSALDAFVDIKNLVGSDPSYATNLEAADALEWKKLLEAASAPDNQFLSDLAEDPLFRPGRKYMKDLLVAAKKKGATRLGAEERFEKASLDAEYKSIYSILSAETHNNTSFVRHRHLKRVGDIGVPQLYSGIGRDSGSIALMLSEILMYASEYIHGIFGTGIGSVRGIRAIVEPARLAAAKPKRRRRSGLAIKQS